MNRLYPTGALCAIAYGLCAGAHAQAADAPLSEPATLAPIAVTADVPDTPDGRLDLDTVADSLSRLGLTPRETPASVTVIDRDTLEARGARTTQEILLGVPGVTAHDAPGNIGVQYRGFSGSSVTQLFNGINVQYGIAARPVDSWIYERVEAIGGPSSFLYGAGGVGGTINVISKLAGRRDITEARLRLGSDELREASVGFNRRLAGDGRGAGSHWLRLDVNHRRANGWVDGNAARATQLAASLLSDLGNGVSHTLAYEYQKEDVTRPYWGTPVLNPVGEVARIDEGTRFKNYNSADGFYGQRVHWLRSITDWQVSDKLRLTNTAYLYDAQRDYRNVETYRFDADNRAVLRSSALLQRHDQRMIGERIEGTYAGSLAGRRSDWAFGVDVSLNKQTRHPTSLPALVSTVDPYDFDTENFFDVPGMSPGLRPDRDNKVTTTAAYLENRTFFAPTVQLVTALRHERIRLDLVNRRAVTAASPASLRRDYTPTTGRAGLVWDITPNLNAYVQYATAADPPSGVLSTASFADVVNNSELTTGRQYEAGAKLDFWDGKGNATLAAYRITRRNIATQDPDDSTLTNLVGRQSSKGVELALGLQPTSRIALQGNLAFIDAQYDEYTQAGASLAGNRPANTPSFVANLWASYAITPAVRAGFGVRHVGRVYADAANTVSWPSYTLLDLGVNWEIDRHWTLSGHVRNATDRTYALNAGTGQVYLGAPRTFDVALHYRY